MTSTPSSLVLGAATRLPPRLFEPFARSLRATNYKGRLVLVLGHYAEEDVQALDALADFSITVDAQYEAVNTSTVNVLRAMRNTRRVRRAYPLAFEAAAAGKHGRHDSARWSAVEYELEGLQALRYAHYYDIVHRTGPETDQVFLSDMRDVLFQRDPFDPPVRRLEVFLEEPSLTVATEPRNRKWVQSLYGRREVTAIGHEVVSCSGTVAGRRDDILRYLDEMSQEIGQRRRPLGSHDQGVHNHLLRRGRFDPVTVVANGYGRVLTMGGMMEIHRDATGRVLNVDGSVPAVLHQYDRHPSVATDLVANLGLSEHSA